MDVIDDAVPDRVGVNGSTLPDGLTLPAGSALPEGSTLPEGLEATGGGGILAETSVWSAVESVECVGIPDCAESCEDVEEALVGVDRDCSVDVDVVVVVEGAGTGGSA